VRIDPCLADADAVAAVGGIAFHYFAGFGGGPKLLFPGLAERSAIAANHRRSLAALPPGGLAPGVEPGRLDGNPVAADLRDVARLLPHAHHLTLWRDAASGRVFGRRWSDLSRFPEVCAAYAEGRRAGAPGRADVVVASAGGWPRDIDVVQAHKALFHATRFAREGAFVLLMAACEEGSGSHALERWLASPDLEALEEGARARYDLNAQTAVSLAALARRFRVRWIGSPPVPDLVRFGFEFTPEPARADGVLADALTRAAAGAGAVPRVVVLPRASEVLPALAGAGARP
jgi:nickel-dependent lactate racemase